MFVYLGVPFIPIYLEYCRYKKSGHKILTFFSISWHKHSMNKKNLECKLTRNFLASKNEDL